MLGSELPSLQPRLLISLPRDRRLGFPRTLLQRLCLVAILFAYIASTIYEEAGIAVYLFSQSKHLFCPGQPQAPGEDRTRGRLSASSPSSPRGNGEVLRDWGARFASRGARRPCHREDTPGDSCTLRTQFLHFQE